MMNPDHDVPTTGERRAADGTQWRLRIEPSYRMISIGGDVTGSSTYASIDGTPRWTEWAARKRKRVWWKRGE
jgi:hypothetical protein